MGGQVGEAAARAVQMVALGASNASLAIGAGLTGQAIHDNLSAPPDAPGADTALAPYPAPQPPTK